MDADDCAWQGVASTSMVARVALLSASDASRSGLAPVSGLEFAGESTDRNTSQIAGVNQLYIIGGDVGSDSQEGDRSKESDSVKVEV